MPENSSSNKRIAKNTVFLYIRMGLVLVVSLFTTRIILRALGVEDYGIQNVVSGFVTMFAFLNTSMSNGVQRFYNFSLGKKDIYTVTDVYNSALLIQALLAVILLVLLETVGIWYMYNKMVIPAERFTAALWVFQFSVASLVVLVMQIPYSAAIMAYERMDYFAYVSIFDVFAKLGVAYAVMIAEVDKLILYGGLNLLVTLIGFLLYFIYAKKHFKDLSYSRKQSQSLFKPMLSFSGWNIFGSFSYMIKSQGLNMLLNLFYGPVVNAARGVSNMVMSAMQGFQSNIVIAFRPQLVQSYASEEYERVKILFFSLSKFSFVMLSVLSIPVIFELNLILKIWLGDVVPDYTIPFTILVLVNMIISSLNTPVSQVVHATGKMRNYQIGTSVVVCLILPAAWIALKLGYNPTSVYWVSLIFTFINQAVCNVLLKKVFSYSISEYLKSVIFPCIIFSIVAAIIPYTITLVLDESLFRAVVLLIVSLLTSCLSAYYIVFNEAEKQMVQTFIHKVKK